MGKIQINYFNLRILIGVVLVFSGFFAITIIGAFYGYSDTVVWFFGIASILVGALIGGPAKLYGFITELLSM